MQFEKMGVEYIIDALRAQRHGGYDYNGIEGLKNMQQLSDFNLEQQAEIAKDYYSFVINKNENAVYYFRFIKDLNNGKFF